MNDPIPVHPHQHFVSSQFFFFNFETILIGVQWYFIVVLIYVSITAKMLNIFACTLCSSYILSDKICLCILYILYLDCFFLLNFRNSLYSRYSPLLVMWFINIFFQYIACLSSYWGTWIPTPPRVIRGPFP